MANNILNFKQQQQLVNQILVPLMQQTVNKSRRNISYPATVVNVYGNYADVQVDYGSTPTTLEKLTNKTGVILNINDIVEILAPNGDLTNAYINKSYNDIVTIAGENIVGVLTFGDRKNKNGEIVFYDASNGQVAMKISNYSQKFYDFLSTQMQVGEIGAYRVVDSNGNPTGTPAMSIITEKGCETIIATRSDDGGADTVFKVSLLGGTATTNIKSNTYIDVDSTHAIYCQPDSQGGNQIYGDTNFEGWNINNVGTINAKNLQISGTKNCVQSTKNFGDRLFYSYEFGDNVLGDWGFGKTNNGECVIAINPIIQESLNIEGGYIVKFYPDESCEYKIEKQPNYFVITTDKDIEFGWEVMAKRRGFEHEKLEYANNIGMISNPNEQNTLLNDLKDESLDMLNKLLFKSLDDMEESLKIN